MKISLSSLFRTITAAALAVGLAPSAWAAPDSAATAAARKALKTAPAPGTSGSGFVANHGQWEREVLFMAPIQGGRAWVTASGIVYDFTKAAKRKQGERGGPPKGLKDGAKAAKPQAERVQGHVVRLAFAGAMLPAVRPGAKLKTRLNYLVGNDPSRHVANVPAYAAVSLNGLWPGVNLRLVQGPDGLGLSFNTVDAAALARARVFVDGAALLEGRGEGALVSTSLGQRSLGAVAVSLGSARYAGKLSGGAVALAPGRPGGTVDGAPARAASEAGRGLVYSTFLGGSTGENGYALAVDASGAAYVTGNTLSSDFPTTPGAYDRTYNDYDAYVTKLSADGSALVYSTLLGGGNADEGHAVAVDASGAAYVTGWTGSSDFPTTPGAFDTTYSGSTDAFVTKLSADGSALVYSTFLGGGGGSDYGYGLVVDASDAVYVAGTTYSSDFPTTPGAFDTTFNGSTDAYVSKLSADGSALVYSTFLGGIGGDSGSAVAVDASGAAYVKGTTLSPDFPITPGAFDTIYDGFGYAYGYGHGDGVVTKLSADGSALVYSTFLGGDDFDGGGAVAVDASGAASVVGSTYSRDFFTTPGAFDTIYGGNYDAHVSKLSADGSALVYSTFLGGIGGDSGIAVAVDASGAAYVTGTTFSSDFPTTPGAFDRTRNGGWDAFVTKLDLNTVFDISLNAAATPTTVAAGGSFTVDYAISNNTDDDVTGDMVFTAALNGINVRQGRVLSHTTVAAHGTLTGSYTQAVPSNAAPGVYTYTLSIGHQPNVVQDQVVLTITVTGAERAGGGATAWKAVRAGR